MAIRPDQPQSIGGVLDTTFQLYKASIGKVWMLCVMGAVGSVISTIYVLVNMPALPDSADPGARLELFSMPGYVVSVLGTMLLSMWSVGAVYLRMHAVGTDVPMGLREALVASIKRVPLMIVMAIVFLIVVTLGLLLLVIPGIILLVSLILSFNLLLIEGKGPIASLTGSHRLIWGNWWRTVVVLSVGMLVILVLYFAVAMIGGFALPLFGIGTDDPLLFAMVVNIVVSFAAALTITPFYAAILVALYWDLKLRKEGGDLAARVSALGTA
jgi:hypothetical protein